MRTFTRRATQAGQEALCSHGIYSHQLHEVVELCRSLESANNMLDKYTNDPCYMMEGETVEIVACNWV
jgi:hypothetical protein